MDKKLVSVKRVRRAAVRGFLTGFVAAAAVFTGPRLLDGYLALQKEQREKVKAEMQERKLQAEFEAERDAVLKAEQEAAQKEDREMAEAEKHYQAKIAQEKKDLEAMHAAGIWPENDDAYCGKCAKCKAMDADYAREMAKKKESVR